ncbi:hypothetical protein ISN44_As12g027990 [Arabidopsis suecica]|uniref:Uncharacterized protein n=1 Tax=Arabidopsis suecica TaxID=45249 RepID=A0A8T1YNI9_ARASU|nr:hypothetical protein ISN44_As12g027990 [Arabidopsis suecica]
MKNQDYTWTTPLGVWTILFILLAPESQENVGTTSKVVIFLLPQSIYRLTIHSEIAFCLSGLIDYVTEKLGIPKDKIFKLSDLLYKNYIPKDKIFELSDLLYKNYGTTMAGLRVRNQYHP